MEHNTDTLASLPAIIAKPSYAQVASLPAAVSSFTIPPPPTKICPIKSIKNINNGGIAIYLTTDEDVSKLSQELSNIADFANFSISKSIRRKPQFILFGVDSSNNKDSITKALLLKNDIFKDGGFAVNFSIKSKSSNNWIISVIPDLYTVIKDHGHLYLNFERVRIGTFISVMQCSTCGILWATQGIIAPILKLASDVAPQMTKDPRCINCTNRNVRFGSGFSENHGCRDKNSPVLIQFKKRTTHRLRT
ncbi:CCHC-type domain-containing protein [Trichonephila clavipes]|nr:CCHC-type domain-containing protein [Trichonephila clavipes]